MSMVRTRHSLARPARVEGIGLFTGCDVVVSLEPARVGTGIVFERDGQSARVEVGAIDARPIHPLFAAVPPRCTSIRLSDGTSIGTTEHLLAALAGCGVSDVCIRVDGPELPIGDGSAGLFVQAIERAGREAVGSTQIGRIDEAMLVGAAQGVRIEILPSERLRFAYALDYGASSPIARATATWDGDMQDFLREIGPARTFCLAHEAEAMRAAGLFGRFSPRELLVIGPAGPIDNAWRFDDEGARHKLLDLIGDLALIGHPFPQMEVRAFGSGHVLNHEAARAVARAMGTLCV